MPRDQQRAWRQLADVTWGAKPSHVPAVEPVSFAGWSRSPAGVPVSQPRADASRRTCPALCSHTHARQSVKGERRGLRHDPSARGALVGRYPNACFRSRSDLKHPFGRGPGKVVSEASAARARGHAGPGLGFSQRGALIPPTQKRAHGARGTGRGERVGPRGGPGSAVYVRCAWCVRGRMHGELRVWRTAGPAEPATERPPALNDPRDADGGDADHACTSSPRMVPFLMTNR